jgi:putative transposase
MVSSLLGLFRLIWLFGKGHPAVVLENLALRQHLAIYQRKPQRPRIAGRDRWFWVALSVVWRNWRKALVVVRPDTVVRWQRERFRRYWTHLSSGRESRADLL